MTNSTYTALVLVIDRSGSMRPIASKVQGALEEFVNEQKQLPGKLTIDTVFFDGRIENRAHFADPTQEDLDFTIEPRGITALYDAVGLKIDSFGSDLAELSEDERPGKVLFVIATDGLENSSKKLTQAVLAEKIKTQREVYAWEFTFIGANQDAVLTAEGLNIPASSALTFTASEAGAEAALHSMSAYVATARSGGAAAYAAEDRSSALAEDHEPKKKKASPRSRKVKA